MNLDRNNKKNNWPRLWFSVYKQYHTQLSEIIDHWSVGGPLPISALLLSLISSSVLLRTARLSVLPFSLISPPVWSMQWTELNEDSARWIINRLIMWEWFGSGCVNLFMMLQSCSRYWWTSFYKRHAGLIDFSQLLGGKCKRLWEDSEL